MANETEPLVWESFLWGLLSAISLNIGSIVGVTCLPRKKVRAMLMSFGGGSLLFALSIELFGHVLSRSEVKKETTPVFVMEGCAILGGILFALLNKALNAHGADVRKPSTTKGRFMRLRGVLMRRLAVRIWKIPFFSELDLPELKELIQSAMNKERYRTGDIIISHETRDSGIFFILSGMVRLYISPDQDGGIPTSPQAIRDLRDPEVHPSLGRHPSLVDGRHPCVVDPSKVAASPAAVGERMCWDLGPDKVFGDMAVLAGTHVGVTAIALESTKVLVLPCHEVMHLIDRSAKVRSHVSRRALQILRQLEAFKPVPDCVVNSLQSLCPLLTFQPGEVVFEGTVCESTPIMSVIFGFVEVTYHLDRTRTTVHGSTLLCADHFRGRECQAFTATAVEATSVLIVQREDLDQAVLLGNADKLEDGGKLKGGAGVGAGPDDAAGPGRGGLRPGSATIVSVPNSGEGRQQGHAAECKESIAAKVVQVMPMTPLGRRKSKDGPNTRLHAALPGQVDDERLSKSAVAWSMPTAADHDSSRTSSWGLSVLGRDLGWEPQEDAEFDFQDRHHLLPNDPAAMEDIVGLVTDQDLEEREQDIAELRSSAGVRTASKGSSLSSASRRKDPNSNGPPTSEGEGENSVHAHGHGAHAAIMVWLGILIDAVPESLVIGILINKSASDPDSSSAEAALPFVIGVFLSNLPESMSSSGSMKAHGIQVRNILLMWWTITFLTAVGASTGALLFPPGSSDDPTTEMVVSGVEGLAAGAMLTMIAQTMLPEAFEQGGDIVGLSCLAGFLCALSVKLIPFSSGDGH